MGLLIDGAWVAEDRRPADSKSRFQRAETSFRDWISADGAGGFPAAAGRYHLYISHACPWAHRTAIMRKLKGLEEAVSLSVVHLFMGQDGWEFAEGPGCLPDTVNGARYLREVYRKAKPDYTGRVSVPVLWDKASGTIVNNESAEIMRMFDTAFEGIARNAVTFCPPGMEAEIDAAREALFMPINNGVYRCGFAGTQEAYEEAVAELFAALDRWEGVLSGQRYLLGGAITEADWCFFTTLIRFDLVYHGHFKCNLRRIADYPNLWNYLRDLYQVPGVAETCDFEHIKGHYYRSHESINPSRIVPAGPIVDFAAPHDRARFEALDSDTAGAAAGAAGGS